MEWFHGWKNDWGTDDEPNWIQRRRQRQNVAEADYSAHCWLTAASFKAASAWNLQFLSDGPTFFLVGGGIMLSHWLRWFIEWLNSLVPSSGSGAKHTKRLQSVFLWFPPQWVIHYKLSSFNNLVQGGNVSLPLSNKSSQSRYGWI